MTILFELRLAIGAEHPRLFYATFTSRTEELVFDRGEEGFFFERTLIFILQRAWWA